LGADDVILFEDECSLRKTATFTRMWAPKGNQPQIESDSDRSRVNIFGTVNPLEGEVCFQIADRQNADTFQEFLEKLLVRYAEKSKIILILDNARIHHAKKIQEFLTKLDGNTPKIELFFQPPYSPELNVIERLWKYLRKQVTHNTFFKSIKDLIEAVRSFFTKFIKPTQVIKSLCTIF